MAPKDKKLIVPSSLLNPKGYTPSTLSSGNMANDQRGTDFNNPIFKQNIGTGTTTPFKNTLANTPAYNASTGLLTDYGRSLGMKEVNAPVTMTTETFNTEPSIASGFTEETVTDTATTQMASSQAELEALKKQQEAERKRQSEELAKQAAEAQKRIDELTAANEGILNNDVKPLTDPFRQKLETSERERLKVEENYFANQKLTNELDGLLTEGNMLAEKLRSSKIPGLAGFQQSPRLVKNLENIQGRAGVIQAVMAARNGQIGQAYNMIDRSVNAIVSDRQDQLSFYNSLINFYGNEKDEEGKKLLNVTKKQEDILNARTKELEAEVARTRENADYIKNLMTNPTTAIQMANAGVTLNDNAGVINKKLADYSYTQEVNKQSNELEADGYETLLPSQLAGKNESDLVRLKDSRGVEHIYWKKPEVEGEKVIGSAETGYYQWNPTTSKYDIRVGGAGTGGATGAGAPAYATDLDALIGNATNTIMTKFGQQTFAKSIASARNDADKINTVATVVLRGSPATIREDFINQTVAIKEIDKAISKLTSGIKTGVLQAGTQYVYNLAGKDFDPKLTELNQLITSAIQPYRNSITGAAWGEQEIAEYQQLFGSTKYSPDELKARLEGVKQLMKDKTIGALNAQVNPLGNSNPFDTGSTNLRSQVTDLGYDYDAMRQQYTDAEIREATGL